MPFQRSHTSPPPPEALSTTSMALSGALAAMLTVLIASPALADEVPAAEAIAAAAAVVPTDAGFSLESTIIGILFGTVVLLLTLITGGVAYINIKQFFDNRQETEDKEKAKMPITGGGDKRASSGAAASSKKDLDEDSILKRGNKVKKAVGKGFSSDFASRK